MNQSLGPVTIYPRAHKKYRCICNNEIPTQLILCKAIKRLNDNFDVSLARAEHTYLREFGGNPNSKQRECDAIHEVQ